MSAKPIPETANRQDWPRLVAKGLNANSSVLLNIAPNTVAVTAAYTVASGIDLVLVDATAGAVTVTLPSASTKRRLTVKKTDASGNAVTLDGAGSETIDGATTHAMTTQYESATVQSDGASWWIV